MPSAWAKPGTAAIRSRAANGAIGRIIVSPEGRDLRLHERPFKPVRVKRAGFASGAAN
jgi:hypothetical protein